MKVQINISNDELIAVNNLLQKLYELQFSQFNAQQKVFVSIGIELADKFDKKCKNQLKKASLFNQKKVNQITLKYYEAWGLNSICIELISWAENSYQKKQLQNIINKLDSWVM